MKRKLWLIICLVVILLSSVAALAYGDTYVGGPWGTRITSLPYEIKEAGSYYLGSNLSYAGGDGITISKDNVTLDLMGFTLTGPGSASVGIKMNGRTNVEIRNGTVSGWNYGISEGNDLAGVGHRILNVRAENVAHGIFLHGSGHLIKGCRATAGGTAYHGLYIQTQGTISGCQTYNFPNTGIEIDSYGMITGNVVISPGGTSGYGIYAGPASLVKGNEVSGSPVGIYCGGAANVIANTVLANSGQVGIQVSTTQPTVLDQNTVQGDGTHYQGITPPTTKTRNNAG